MPGDEHSRQRDVFELVQVVKIVVDGQASFTRPLQASATLPCAAQIRAFRAALGRASGKGVLMNWRCASSSRPRAPSMSPSVSVEPSLGDTPAPPPYRQLPLLAQFLASQQVYCGGGQVTPFRSSSPSPRYRSAVSGGRGSPRSTTACSSRVSASDACTQTTQRRPDIGQDSHGADRVGDVAGRQQSRGVAGEDPVGGLQVAARPVRHRHERDRLFPPELVSFGQELEHPLGVLHGAGHITERMGTVGTGHSYGRQQRPQLLFVHSDRRSGPPGLQPALGVRQPGLGSLDLTGCRAIRRRTRR